MNLLAMAVGGVAWSRSSPSLAFWQLLRLAQLATAVFVLFEAVIYATGARAEYGLHYLYAFLPVFASLLAEGTRAASARQELGDRDLEDLDQREREELAVAVIRRETGVMAISGLVVGFLVWRAVETTAGMF